MPERVQRAASCYSDVRMAENTASDIEFMRAALAEARDAAQRGEVPIGAVLTLDDRIIARAGNRTISDCDPTAHAEIVALRAASKIIGNYRLLGATLYVTIEPCAMCCGAMIQARICRLVYGADDAKAGAVRSCFAVLDHPQLNHRVATTPGVLTEDSGAILKEFFSLRR
jgi:tRNA(adenine34) deaminase